VSHGVLLCDKAAGRSSHGIVALLRKALQTRDVGHAGTLDPMATGVLVLAVGEGLKVLRYLVFDDKVYEGTVRLGTETHTHDAEGKVVATAAVPDGLSLDDVNEVCRRFIGQITQRAPTVSALKQGGVALFERVRRGEIVEAPERSVFVESITVLAVRAAEIDLRVHCGKGFYVRALARDLGIALGTLGHLSALRRVRSGGFTLDGSVTTELLVAAASGDVACRQELASKVWPIGRALGDVLRLSLDDVGVGHVRQGRPVPSAHVVGGAMPNADAEIEPVLLCDAGGTPVALARCSGAVLHVVRGLHLSPPSALDAPSANGRR
jgi:tRNA pseudouridine55 synthase